MKSVYSTAPADWAINFVSSLIYLGQQSNHVHQNKKNKIFK